MKVSYIIHTFYPAMGPGGPITSTLHTTKELASKGVQIYVSTTDCDTNKKLNVQTNTWLELYKNLHVKYYKETILGKLSLSQFFGMWNDIRKVNLVHIQGLFNLTTPLGLFLSWVYTKPVVLSPRGALGLWCLQQGNNYKRLWLDYLIKPFMTNIHWHATSQQEADEIKAVFSKAKVFIIPNGIDLNNEDTRSRKECRKYLLDRYSNEKNIDKVVISMGRLEKKKGFDILVDAFHNTLNAYPNSILLIAGRDEGAKVDLEKKIEYLGLENKIFLIGQINGKEKNAFFLGADLFVLPSHNENFGNVYAESLAAGTPIVASTNTPWEEVEKARCGKWVDNNVDSTSKAMLMLLEAENDEVRIASKKFIEKYKWSNIAEQFLNIYKKLACEK